MKIANWNERGSHEFTLHIGPFFAKVKPEIGGDGYEWEVYFGNITASSHPIADGTARLLFEALRAAQDVIKDRVKAWTVEVDGDA